jgi:hypothetical protein
VKPLRFSTGLVLHEVSTHGEQLQENRALKRERRTGPSALGVQPSGCVCEVANAPPPSWFAVLLWTGCLVFSMSLSSAPADGLRAGFAKTDITPTQPVTMSGYESRKGLSQGVHDPLSARVIAFEHEGHRLVLVSTDVIGFYGSGTAESVRKAILDACQLRPAELFLCAIHTHSAPSVTFDAQKGHSNNLEYSKALQGKLAEVARAALAGLAPVKLGVGTGASPVGANRRELRKDDTGNAKIVLGRNPSALTDREVQVLKVTHADANELAAVLFAYATHSTSMGPRNYLISGDVHGLAEQFLERYLGAGVLAPAFAGASGDIDPWYRVLPEFKTTNGWMPELVLLGTMLGEEVAHVLAGIQKLNTNGPVSTLFKTIELPGKPRGEAQPAAAVPPVPFNITVGRVGDVAFAGLGGEVFNGLGQAIKAASPFLPTLVITHCNGAAGYVPTRPSYAEGGYEVQSTAFGPGAGERLVEAVGGMLQELRNAPP